MSAFSVLGDTVLRGFHTIFDRSNEQIGFASANKAACGNKVAGGINVTIIPSTFADQVRVGLWIVLVFAACIAATCLLVYGGRRAWRHFSKGPIEVVVEEEEREYVDIDTSHGGSRLL